jgi:hypothetical protein
MFNKITYVILIKSLTSQTGVEHMSKMIGIRVPAESDLPERLKKLGIHLRKSHGELLEMWVRETENRKDLFGGKIFNQEGAPNETTTGELTELQAQVKELAERVAVLESRAPDTATPAEKSNATVTPENTVPAATVIPEFSAPTSQDGNANTEAVARILELSAEGLSTRKIAVRLNADGIPTLTGGVSWNHGAVAKVLKQQAKE